MILVGEHGDQGISWNSYTAMEQEHIRSACFENFTIPVGLLVASSAWRRLMSLPLELKSVRAATGVKPRGLTRATRSKSSKPGSGS
jgi:hypothetical protein